MWFVLALVLAGGLAVVAVTAQRSRRAVSQAAAETDAALGPLLEVADASLQVRYLEDAFELACQSAGAAFGAEQIALVYLTEDRTVCRCLVPTHKPIELPTVFWNALLNAPWQDGVLSREMLAEVSTPAVAMPLEELSSRLRADLLRAWIERGRLICVVVVTLGLPLGERERTLLDLWYDTMAHACANHIIERHVNFQRTLLHEVEQARVIMDSLPSRASAGDAKQICWSVYERPQAMPGTGFWDVYELSGGRILIVAGEMIAGGLAASMLSIAVRSCCDTLFELTRDELEPYRVLDSLNRFLWRETNPMGMACVAALFDPHEGVVEYAVAGLMGLWRMHWREDRALVEPCPGQGPPVGSGPAADYLVQRREMESDDVFFVLSQRVSRSVWRSADAGEPLPDVRFDGASAGPVGDLRDRFVDVTGVEAAPSGAPIIIVRRQEP